MPAPLSSCCSPRPTWISTTGSPVARNRPPARSAAQVGKPHPSAIAVSDDGRVFVADDVVPQPILVEVAAKLALKLAAQGKPFGGKFSFDADNRQPWSGQPPAPRWPRFEPDAITCEVLDLVDSRFPHAFGRLDGFAWPCSAAEVQAWWQFALVHALPLFGPYEDAMAEAEPMLFHTGVSPLLNLGRLLPQQLVDDAVAACEDGRVPLASAEGFVRQVLGWREFVKQVHDATDGFRQQQADGAPNALSAGEALPPVFWGHAPSGLRCLDGVVDHVHAHGWSHHITRLMVLCNIATLLGVRPRELTDWFWAAYVDAYDWVVEPNVIGMGTYGVGDLLTTKPYVSGAAYIDRMSDYCKGCAFHPKKNCPVTSMYWNFLDRNGAALADAASKAVEGCS